MKTVNASGIYSFFVPTKLFRVDRGLLLKQPKYDREDPLAWATTNVDNNNRNPSENPRSHSSMGQQQATRTAQVPPNNPSDQ